MKYRVTRDAICRVCEGYRECTPMTEHPICWSCYRAANGKPHKLRPADRAYLKERRIAEEVRGRS